LFELDAVNNKKKNNHMDCLIAETSIKNDITLVTSDKDLKVVAGNNNCKVHYVL